MTDAELRALVRDAVARYAGGAGPPAPLPVETVPNRVWAQHPSHQQFLTLVNVGEACVIEPAVACNHCGYCKSHGH